MVSPGDAAFTLTRRVTVPRLAAALVLVGSAGFIAALRLGWLGPTPMPMLRVEAMLPPETAKPAATAATESPAAAEQAALPPSPAPPRRDRSTAQPLLPAPDPALVETGPDGPLPIISRDGRQPWRVYARPFDRSDKRPRIAVIITGLGPSGAATQAAIDELPGAATLAFNPYAQHLPEWVGRARAAGHEVLISLPMEPADYPRQDPGPYTLLTSLSAKENLDRLDWLLSRVTGYVGVTNMMGGVFTTSQANLVPVFDELKKRGLMFVDGRASAQSVAGALAQSMGLPRVIDDEKLDAEATRDAIDRHLAGLEATARRNGIALGIGSAYPVTLERVTAWASALEAKGMILAPASALVASPSNAKAAAK